MESLTLAGGVCSSSRKVPIKQVDECASCAPVVSEGTEAILDKL